MDDLQRWSARRKAVLLLAIDNGLMAQDEATCRFGLSGEELTAWRRHFKAYGWPEVRATRLQFHRQRARAVVARGPLLVAATVPRIDATMTVGRDGHRTNCKAKLDQIADKTRVASALGEPQEEQTSQASALGMHLASLTSTRRKQLHMAKDVGGVVVSSVDDGSTAAQVGLTNGDVILLIDRQPVHTPDEAAARLKDAEHSPEKTALLLVNRDNVTAYLRIPLDEHQG